MQDNFCISRIQIDEAIASTTCVEVKKEALARRILQVRQLLTLPGTCLIDNASNSFERHVGCIAALAMKQVLVEEPDCLKTEL